ncbi:MAG: DUF4270 family protein [Bacteroidales bacterium]|jgi:hypothetical protein|nr:DUF4270 family protein [Bacteroidales bacterium]
MIKRTCSIILSAFLLLPLASCITVDNRMGSDLIPSNQVLSINWVEFEAPMFTAVADSMNMSAPAYLAFGSVISPLFGKTSTSALVQFAPYTYQTEYGKDPIVSDMFVNIPVGGFTVFSDSDRYIPQNVYVYRLVKDLDHLDIYHKSFSEEYIDPIPVSKPGMIFLGRDTLRIDFTEAFAYELLQADSIERDSTDAFINRFKGLYITTDPLGSEETGGRINYLNISEANLYLNYKSGDGDSLLTYFFNIYGTYYNISSHQSSHLAVEAPSEHLYYEGLAGVKPCLNAAVLATRIKAWGQAQTPPVEPGRIMISRADLVMPVEIPSNQDYSMVNRAPGNLYPSRLVSGDTLTLYSPLKEIYYDNSGGTMNRTHWEYTFEITSYLQEILKKGTITPSDNLWIMPTYAVSGNSSDTWYVDNYTYRNTILNGNLSDRPPYVRITYAVLLQ